MTSSATSSVPPTVKTTADRAEATPQAPNLAAPWKGWRPAVRLGRSALSCLGEFRFLMCVAVAIGMVTGLAAFAFKESLGWVAGFFLPDIEAGEVNWWIVWVPVAGILLTGIFTRYVVRTDLTHGVGELMQDLRHGRYNLRHNLVYSSVVGGTITLGMGGSSGAEGPIAYTGAAIGSNIGQVLGLDARKLKILVACGASAGIAAIFSAPLGGLMFSLELLGISLQTLPVLACMTACLTAWLTIFTCHGFQPDIAFRPLAEGFDLSLLPATALLGLLAGIYCVYYSGVVNRMDVFYKKLRNPWVRNLTGGAALGIMLLVFPSMFGVGYPVTTSMINGVPEMARGSVLLHLGLGRWTLPLAAAGILLCKCWAVSSTNSSGGVGGDFAPTLFAGSMAGYLFATLANEWCGCSLPVWMFSYFGMAAVMAGAIQTPLMAIFIVLEACSGYAFALPVTVCAAFSYLTVKAASARHKIHPVSHHHFWFDRHESDSGKTAG